MSDPRMEVIVQDDRYEVTVQDDHYELIVDDTKVEVITVGIQGPPGVQGPQGLPGTPGVFQTVSAPLQAEVANIRIAPGTVNGQGLIWNGTAWVNTQLVPQASAGAVPYVSGAAFTGDSTNLRYEPSEQALYVSRLGNTLLDGGNF